MILRLSAIIEYDVALVDRSQYAHSPLLVEVEKSPGALLGINLAAENATKTNNQRAVVIESITSASIAERFSFFFSSFKKKIIISEQKDLKFKFSYKVWRSASR